MKIKVKRKSKRTSNKRTSSKKRIVKDVLQVIHPKTIPYTFWKEWNKARERGEIELLYNMCSLDGPYRKAFPTLQDFKESIREQPLPQGPEWNLEKIKLDEMTAYLLTSRGVDDPGIRSVDLELLVLRKTRHGWRLHEVHRSSKKKERAASLFISFQDFGIPSLDYDFHQRLQAGFVREDLADYPKDSPSSHDASSETDS